MKGVFKCIDFGLAFSVEEEELHQVIVLFIIIITVVVAVIIIIFAINIVIMIGINIVIMIGMMGNLQQIQSSGYRSPEAAAWNKHKVLKSLKNFMIFQNFPEFLKNF